MGERRGTANRLLAWFTVALLGASGLALSESTASAATAVSNGKITVDPPNAVSELNLDRNFRQQFFSRPLGGKAFYTPPGSTTPNAHPVVVDRATNQTVPIPVDEGKQRSGGIGTVGDPFWLETTVSLPSTPSPLELTQRLSYVVGTEHVRNDMTVRNPGTSERNLQFGQYADCFFNGDDRGTSNITPGLMVQCVQAPNAMSLIAVSPEPAFAGGHYLGALNAASKPMVGTPQADKCWASGSTTGECPTFIDNGFAAVWGAKVAPGAAETRTLYLSYTDDLRFVDLKVGSSVSETRLSPGDTTQYTLNLRNGGPHEATGNKVAFQIPAGLSVVDVNGDGSYREADGTWVVPVLPVDGSAQITITVRADRVGEFTTQVVATSSEGIDAQPCQASGGCGEPLTVWVSETGSAEHSTLSAEPSVVTADGESAATVTVTAINPSGDRVNNGGAEVELFSSHGVLSEVTDHGDGTYTATLTATETGRAEVSMRFNGTDAPARAEVEFRAGAVDFGHERTGYVVSDGDQLVGSGEHSVTVQLVDAHGNPVPDQSAALTASTSAALGTGAVGAFEPGSEPGSYVARITATVAGEKPIAVELAGAEVQPIAGANTTARFIAGEIDPAHEQTSFVVSTGEQVVGAGEHTITVTLADALGNPVSGAAARVALATADPLGAGTIAELRETSTPGTYTAQITSTMAGDKTIAASADGVALRASGNERARFVAGPVDPSHADTRFTVSEGEVSTDGGAHSVTATLRDEFGNAVRGQQIALAAATSDALGGGNISGFVETAAGEYTATITSTIAGAKVLAVDHSGTSLSAQGNDIARFVPGGVDTGHADTRFSVSEGTRVVGVGQHVVSVRLADANGNPVPGQSSALSAQSDTTLGGGALSAFSATGVPGQYEATVTSTVAGLKRISVAFGGEALAPQGNRDARFIAGGVDPGHADTRFSVSLGDEVVGIGSHTVTVRLADAHGNPVPGVAGELTARSVQELGEGAIEAFVETGIPGTYEARVTSTLAGGKTLRVGFSGAAISAAGNDTAHFVAGPADLGNQATRFSVSSGDELVGTGRHEVTATLADRYGNPVSGSAQGLRAVTPDPLGSGALGDFVEADEPGIYVAEVTSSLAGGKVIAVALGDAAVIRSGNNTARFVAGEVDLEHADSRFQVSEGDVVVGAGEHAVTVRLSDRFGNPVPGQAGELAAVTAEPLGAGGITGFAETGTPGTYRAAVTSTVAGVKVIAAEFGGAGIRVAGNAGASFVAGEVDLAHASTSYTVSEGDASVTDGSHSVEATLVDRYGNPVSAQQAALAAATGAPLGGGGITGFVETGVAGTYRATITSTVAGEKPVTVALGDGTVDLSGNGVARFVAGGVSVADPGTRFTVTEGDQTVGTGEHTVTVTLADRHGNPVPGQATGIVADAVQSLGGGAITEFRETGPLGTYTATVTSTSAGAKTIEVRFAGDAVAVEGNRVARFVAGSIDPGHERSGYSVSEGEEVVARGAHTVTVTAADRYGNPVSGRAAELGAESLDPLGAGTLTEFTETTDAGTYTATVTSTIAGAKRITANATGEQLSTLGNDTARFIAGAVDPGHENTVFLVSEGEELVGAGEHTVTATLADRFGNPVHGAAAEIRASTEADLGAGAIGSFAEGDSGSYTATVTSTIAGAKAIAVEHAGDELRAGGNDTARFIAGAVDPTHADTRFTVSSGDAIAGVDAHTVRVALADRWGNPVPGQDAELSAATEAELGTGAIGSFAETATPGIYTAPVTSSIAGAKLISATHAGSAISAVGNDTARFIAGRVAPGHAETGFTVSEGERVVGAQPHEIVVTLRDAHGNVVRGAAAELAARASGGLGAGVVSGFTETETPGRYTASVSSTRAGAKLISVAHDGEALAARGNGTAVFVADQVDLGGHASGYLVTTGAIPVDRGAHRVTATLADRFGNPVSGAAAGLLAGTSAALGEGSISAFGETATPGSYVAEVKSTLVGVKPITVEYGGAAVSAAGNAEAHFVAGSVDATRTRIDATERIKANGRDVGEILVTLFDRYGNRVLQEQRVEITSTVGEVSGQRSLGNGEYAAELRSRTAGIAHVTAAINGVPSGVVVPVTLVQQLAPAPPTVEPSDGDTLSGCAVPGSTVTVRDANGNVIGTAIAGDDCRFTVRLHPRQDEGSRVTVTATDEEGNESEPTPLRIGLIKMELEYDERRRGQEQAALGENFQPGEEVIAVLRELPGNGSDPTSGRILGEHDADDDGSTRFEFTVPKDAAVGRYEVELTGSFSGAVSEQFRVIEPDPKLPVTGGGGIGLLLAGSALLILGGGSVAIADRVGRRRAAAHASAEGAR